MSRTRIGIDLGGTKTEAVLISPAGTEVVRRRVETPQQDYAATVRMIAGLVSTIEMETASSATVGIGMPGAISPATGLVKNANSTWLIGQPFHRDLELALGRPVRVANDANCLALSEASDGSAAGAEIVFAVILGTGVGGGIAIRGRPVTGVNAIAGEWGHNPLPRPRPDEHPGPRCYCGQYGCIETFLSGPSFSRAFEAATGRRLRATEIAEAADAGDPTAEAAMLRYEERLARALAAVINLLDPDAIVLGGGLSKMDRLYRTVPALWGEHVFSDRVDTRLLPPLHGDSSGVRGAAWLWPAEGDA